MMHVANCQALLNHFQLDFDRILPAFPLPELERHRIFVTGGTGFIGYWLLLACHWLNKRGAGIQLTLLSRSPERFLSAHPECRDFSWIEWIKGDIKDYVAPTGHFDAFIHGAADTSPAAARSLELFDDITIGTQHVIDHAVAAGARRLLLISSGAVYGEQPGTLTSLPEDFPGLNLPLNPDDAYGRGKRMMEDCALSATQAHPIEPIIARCFSFVGYGLPGHLAASQFIDDALHNDRLQITGDGRAIRSYLHAADLAVWLLALLARGKSKQAYNVGSPTPVSLRDLATLTRNTLAPEATIEILNRCTSAARQRYVPDTRRIMQELKVDCWTSLKQGIVATATAQKLSHQSTA